MLLPESDRLPVSAYPATDAVMAEVLPERVSEVVTRIVSIFPFPSWSSVVRLRMIGATPSREERAANAASGSDALSTIFPGV